MLNRIKEASLPSLFRFIKTIVVHLILERHCFNTKDQEVNISLFTVQRSSLLLGPWSNMQTILRNSLSDPHSESTSASTSADADAAKVIEILKRAIKTPPLMCSDLTRRLLKNLERILENIRVLFPSGMHCEAILASLKKYFESSREEDNNACLESICKVC
jgi:hypothetical protein